MQLIDAENAEGYLRQKGRIEPGERVEVRELAGGVSNLVLLVSRGASQPDFVLKQARRQLRVADPWFCSVERIGREIEVLRICTEVLSQSALAVRTPSVLFADHDNYLFAMTAAPVHQVWKQQLLRGDVESKIAADCGQLLGTMHAATWQDSETARRLGDRTYFEDLRVDPYYRHLARSHPKLQPALERLIHSLDENRLSLVHGDFSPKNLLVHDGGLLLVDFEVGHFGDPAFDLGFFLSHLVLKAVFAGADSARYLELTERFWREYRRQAAAVVGEPAMRDLERRAVMNWAGCLLARVDGKSKVDYLSEPQQQLVRCLGQRMIEQPPDTWPGVLREVRKAARP